MIVFTRAQLKEIVDAAEAAWPDECCGLLVGEEGPAGALRVTRVVASANLAGDEAERRFEIDPRLRLDLARKLEGARERVVGLYHSHPTGPAQPSPRDLEAAWEPEQVWLVVALADGQAVQLAAHRFADGGRRFCEIPLRTEDWEPDAEGPAKDGPGLS